MIGFCKTCQQRGPLHYTRECNADYWARIKFEADVVRTLAAFGKIGA